MLDNATLAARLRAAMERVGMSSAELARRCHVSPQAVYEWRRTGRIHKGHLMQIVTALEIPLSALIDERSPLAAHDSNARGGLRYALHTVYPDLSETDVTAVLAYADGLARARARQES